MGDPVCDVIIGNIPGALSIELCPSHKDCEPQAAKCILVKETRCSHNASLHSHTDTQIGEKPVKCHIFRKQFSRRSYLQRHKHSHAGEKLIKGVTSRATCSRSVGVQSHVRTQRGEKELTRDTGEAQKSQTRTHTGENPHKRDTSGIFGK